MPKFIVIGASSGIGKELARVLSTQKHAVGLAARRIELLHELRQELPSPTYVKQIDLSQPVVAMELLRELIAEMGGVDAVIICSGTCSHNPELKWEEESGTIDVNVAGFTAMANVAFNYFRERGAGHIVGISSFRAVRGGWSSPAYNASKAYVSNYLEGLRVKAKRLKMNIVVTDVRPGLVATPMIQREEGLFVASAKKAALQISRAIAGKQSMVYVTRRYSIIAYLMRKMPFALYSRM